MKKSLLLFTAVCLSVSAMAVPAHPGKRLVQQPDGSTIEMYVHGDEIYHYYTDAENNLLQKDANGFWQRTSETVSDDVIRARRAASRVQHRAAIRRVGGANLISKGLVILTQFKDTKFKSENTKAAFEEMLNGDSYTYNGATGSVKKYFQDQSSNTFTPTFVVYGPVTLTGNQATYGGNDSYGYDIGVGKMVKEAVQLAYQQYGIDFSEFDADGDGEVDFVDILYAGYGEADSEDENAVWPCEWSLSSSDVGTYLTLGGKKIDTFSCHQELDGYGSMKGKRSGIATACHEFGHVFGLPDFYDTEYKNPTLGDWDIMDGGSYNNNGRTPPAYSGYERMFTGWAKARVLNSPENVTLQELQSSQEVLVISETGVHNLSGSNPNPKTFFILENRQQTGWDKYLPGHGMLIWKIQYNASWWSGNTVNNRAVASQGVALVPADGKVDYTSAQGQVQATGDAGDPYPGTSHVTEYSPYENYPITDIREQDGVITFKFMKTMRLSYSLQGVQQTGGSAEGGIEEGQALSATFTARQGYFALTESNTTVRATVGGTTVTPAVSFSNGTLTVSLTAAQVTGSVEIAIAATRDPSQMACDDYSYTYTAAPEFGRGISLGGIAWDITMEGSTTVNYNSTNGAQFGDRKNPATGLTLLTSDFIGCPIGSVVVNAKGAAAGDAKMSVYVGTTQLGTEQALGTKLQDYTFPNTTGAEGELKIVITNTQGAFFVKTIQVKTGGTAVAYIDSEEVEIRQGEGMIMLQGISHPTEVAVYSATGQCLSQETLQADAVLRLPRGLYLIRINHKTYKTTVY